MSGLTLPMSGLATSHFPLMKPILDTFEQTAAKIHYASPQIILISNVTGQRAGDEIKSSPYWRQHILSPVQFTKSIAALQQQGYNTFIEIGPQPTLLGMARRCWPEVAAVWLPSLRSGHEDWSQLLESLSALFVHGAEIDWSGFYRDEVRQRVILPTYPFQRERYWLEQTDWLRPGAARQHPLLGAHISLAHTTDVHVWEGEINTQLLPYLDDHRVQDVPVVPATAYMEMVMAAAAQAFGAQSFALTDMKFHKPITLPEGASPAVQVILSQADGQSASAQIFSRLSVDASWTLHATGQLKYDSGLEARHWDSAEIEAIKTRCREELSGEEFYRLSSAKGNQWGAAFQGVQHVWRGDREALSLVQVPATLQPGLERYVFHPAVSDACGHVLTATISPDRSDADRGGAFVGGSVDETRVYARPRGQQFWAYARLRPDTEQQSNILIGDVQVIDENGIVISETLGAHLWYLDKSAQRALSESIDDWFYDIQWEPAARSTAQPIAHAPGTWLILSDRAGVSEQLVMALRARGERAICVTASDTLVGEAYERVGEDQYCIRPDHADDLRQLVSALLSTGQAAWRGAVHLWSLDAPALTGRESLDIAQTLNTVSVLHLIQTLAPIEWQEFPRIWLITRSAQSIGASPVALAQTPVWGLGRTLALEHSELWGGLIDLDAAATPGEAANDLLSEIVDRSHEDQIAFRGGQRYVARLAHHARLAANAPAFQLQAEASYLITGGLGGLGLLTAQWLVEQGARQLVLIGRRAPSSEAQTALQNLQRQGAEVRVWQADVADYDQLARVLETINTSLPPLRGIIHAAGVLDDSVIVQQDRARFEKVFGPKVQGAWNLHLLTQSLPLDFFVLFSSASTVLGSVGQSNYAAANAFMDALAHDRRARGLPALSINWGAWAEVGMAAALDERDKRRLQRSGFGLIAPHAGLQMLAQLLRSNHTQLIAVPIDWPQLLQAIGPEHIPPLLSDRARQVHVTQTARSVRLREDRGVSNAPNDWQQQLAAAAPERRAELIVNYLCGQAARVMGVRAAEALSLDQPLNDLGLDSLMAVEMKNHIESDLGVVVPMVKLLQGPSVAQLAAHVMAQVVALKPATSPEPASAVKAEDQPEAQQLLAQLDQLSDDQVDALLTDLLIAEGQPDE